MTTAYGFVYAVCVCIATGGILYYGLVLVATWQYRRSIRKPAGFTPPITILKPLAGLEDNLEENLRTFFEQDYPQYQLLFAVHDADDPAAQVVRSLKARYPERDAELIVTGQNAFPNAKVTSLHRMAQRARHSILVVSDSDIRATPGYLRSIAIDFSDPRVSVATCPYRAEPGPGFWSRLEALTLNTEFWCGVLVARLVEGMQFAVGPTMTLRREYLDAIGGFGAVGEYLAEDFVLGQWAERHGYKAVLSGHVVDHCIGGQPFLPNIKHRVRWARSTRRSRPLGYVGQVFSNPLPFAILLLASAAAPLGWLVLALRAAVAAAVSRGILRDRLTKKYWWLVPVADVTTLVVWVMGFFGDTVEWRGRRYRLFRDGRVLPAEEDLTV